MKKMKDTREKMYRFRANEEESELIEKKYMLSSCQSMSDFFRQMILYGMVVKYDEKQLDRMSDLIEKISLNFNQIAVRINSTNRSYAEDIAQMKQEMKEIWQLQKSIQLQLQKLKP
ncbi:MAG: plasmid mobilization relaxosome protein MobC [Oscillospiraceae bacterium]